MKSSSGKKNTLPKIGSKAHIEILIYSTMWKTFWGVGHRNQSNFVQLTPFDKLNHILFHSATSKSEGLILKINCHCDDEDHHAKPFLMFCAGGTYFRYK